LANPTKWGREQGVGVAPCPPLVALSLIFYSRRGFPQAFFA